MIELVRRACTGGAAAVDEELLEGPAAARNVGNFRGPGPVGPCENPVIALPPSKTGRAPGSAW